MTILVLVRQKVARRLDGTYDLVFDTIGLSPSTHNKGIVVGDAGDDVDTLRLEGRDVRDVAGKVLRAAAWSESTGDAEEDNLLASPF
jgi:hypothetical protein